MKQMLEKMKTLYSVSFSDSREYADFYFYTRLAGGGQVEYIAQEEELISELFLFYRQLCFFGKKLSAALISGACTAKEYRGQGHMNTLLKTTLNKLYDNGTVLAYLYPYSHAYYEKTGFVTFSKMQESTYLCNRELAQRSDMRLCQKLYLQAVKAFNLYTKRSVKDFYEIFDGIEADKGQFYLLKNGGKNVGYNYFDSFAEQNELITVDRSILIESGYPCYVQCEFGEPYSMARCVNVLKLLSLAKIKKSATFQIIDPIILQNNISVSIDSGAVVVKNDGGEKIEIADLTRQILGSVESDFFENKKNINFEKY